MRGHAPEGHVQLRAGEEAVSAGGDHADALVAQKPDVPAEVFDAEKAFSRLLSEVKFDAELEDASDMAEYMFADLPEDTEVKMYMADGAYSDSVIMLKGSDKAAIRAALDEYLSSLKKEAGRYNPEELTKLEKAVIFENGDYVFCCVTADSETVNSILH